MKRLKKAVPIDAVERGGGPVEHLDETQRLQAAGIGELLEQRPQHRSAQMPDGFVPVEGTSGRRHPARPEHPGGEDAVEERLHERGAEEGRAALALESDAEGLLQGRTNRRERGRVARRLDPRQTVARVRGEQPGEVLWLGQRGAVRERTAEVFAETGSDPAGEGAGRLQQAVELLGAVREPEGLQLGGASLGIFADEQEVAGVGYENEAIAAPVAADLIACGAEPSVVIGGLNLDNAALGELAFARPAASAPAGRRRGPGRDGPRRGRPAR